MAKKDSNLKKVGRFVTNELLGVDDAKRAFKKARKGDYAGAKRSAETAAFEVATTVLGAGVGTAAAKIGLVAGKAAARSTSKKVGKEVLKSSDKAKGSGSMVYPKSATGKKTATAPKRDVVVKTADKTYALNGFVNKKGERSIKTSNTNKPTVRVVEKQVTRDMANTRTAQSNKLRYGNAKADAARAREASVKASRKPAVGKVAGAVAGTAVGAPARAVATKSDKQKKK